MRGVAWIVSKVCGFVTIVDLKSFWIHYLKYIILTSFLLSFTSDLGFPEILNSQSIFQKLRVLENAWFYFFVVLENFNCFEFFIWLTLQCISIIPSVSVLKISKASGMANNIYYSFGLLGYEALDSVYLLQACGLNFLASWLMLSMVQFANRF